MNESLAQIDHLTKNFVPKTRPALHDISSMIPKGQIIGVVGPDGAGKTTLIRLMAGLLHPTSGNITILGKDSIQDAALIHEMIGYMPQKFGLYEELTVEQNLNLYANLKGVPQEEREEIFKQLLHFTGLEPFTGRFAGKLSGGMKQKLGLACTLLKKPRLLLLDEPSVGVDPISRRELWKMINALIEEGITVIWSTSYLDEAQNCHLVLLLNKGELVFQGEPDALTQKVNNRVFAITDIEGSRRALLFKVLDEENVLDGVIQGKNLHILTSAPSPPSADAKCKVVSTTPRFEDGFMDILGGGPGSHSRLAEITPEIKQLSHSIVEAKDLTKKFGSFTAVDNVSFSLNKNEIFGLLGPNGAGKTTTYKMLCGLLHPTEGKAFVNGMDFVTAPGPARARIGYMAQKFSLYGSLSVIQNLRFFAGAYNLVGKEKKEAVEQMIEIFELKSYISANADSLPIGYKQRLALACANMHHPEVLFLDEPTSGVDPITRREFWNHINGLVEKGVTILITTHFLDEAEYCDRVALIYRGQIIQMAPPDDLKALVKTEANPNPSLEDAFIQLIEEYDNVHAK